MIFLFDRFCPQVCRGKDDCLDGLTKESFIVAMSAGIVLVYSAVLLLFNIMLFR